MQKIYEMLTLQNQLNNDTNGIEWRKGKTKNGKVINWKRCIYMETAELIDSFPWKHWKSIYDKPDLNNVKIELVDIWHFLMSYLLVYNEIASVANLINNLKETKSDLQIENWDNEKVDEYLDIFEELMALALIKSDTEQIQELLLEQFFKACDSAGLSFDELYKLYIAKNALNQFRQLHGYKEGTYQKSWNGKEDNEVMQKVLSTYPDIDYKNLLNFLEREYQKVIS